LTVRKTRYDIPVEQNVIYNAAYWSTYNFGAAANAAQVAYTAAYASYTSAASTAASAAAYSTHASATNWTYTYNTFTRSYNENQFQEFWKTSDNIELAKHIWNTRNLANLPILADSLEESGVPNELVKHLREDNNTLADWFLWNLNLTS
jgi:hypothetical protein